MPDFPIGTILAYPVPGTRFSSWHGDDGEPHPVPAVVLGQFSDEAIKLFVLHFEGQFQQIVLAATAAQWQVLYRPGEIERLIQTVARMQREIDALLQIVERLSPAVRLSELEKTGTDPLYWDMTPTQAPKLPEDESFLPVRKHPQRARAAMGGSIPPPLDSKD
ncbi:MAG TPA: hypothetical protein VEL77_15350 [Rugosimonospora sp.]|nr:hypothetical protein [Rugosimonospora sp.]